MAVDIVMPNLGFDTQEGRLIEWLKQIGDPVERGEAIAIVESDKADVELESIASGTLIEQLAGADQVVAVGAVLARVGEASERPAASASPQPATTAPEAESERVKVSPVARRIAKENNLDLNAVQGTGSAGRITRADVLAHANQSANQPVSNGDLRALPKVRKAARDLGIDLHDVPATGTSGQVTLADLQAYQASLTEVQAPPPQPQQQTVAAAPQPEPQPAATPAPVSDEGGTVVAMSRTRQIAGERLSRSMRDAPHFYVSGEFDLEAALKTLETLQTPTPKPRVNDLLQYLTVQTLLAEPALNATFDGSDLRRHQNVNLAIAVSRGEDLLTPVIARAERYSLSGLTAESRDLIQRVQGNKLKPADLQGGTFTISNLGVVKQVEQFTAVINPPQIAILAVGTVKPRPVVIDGGLHIHRTVKMTLSGDHRVVDGMALGRFFAAFQQALDQFR